MKLLTFISPLLLSLACLLLLLCIASGLLRACDYIEERTDQARRAAKALSFISASLQFLVQPTWTLSMLSLIAAAAFQAHAARSTLRSNPQSASAQHQQQ
ncbi:Transmembrane adaptor Erv26 [Ceraceosorus bombacis]|uniref:Transmembrane adaptor Erv26 n=1 Tax=Ceraceosorus bombacis TaxID=401625 RepID=A0A0P1BNG0_9BASI|nr:Transmembrane adaptor Erv26 [Ceraceosorus bombacis]